MYKKKVKTKDLDNCLRVTRKYWKTGDIDYLGTIREYIAHMLREYSHDYDADIGVSDLMDVCARKKYTLAKAKVGMNFLGYEVIDDEELENPGDMYI